MLDYSVLNDHVEIYLWFMWIYLNLCANAFDTNRKDESKCIILLRNSPNVILSTTKMFATGLCFN